MVRRAPNPVAPAGTGGRHSRTGREGLRTGNQAFTARFLSSCVACGQHILPGQKIRRWMTNAGYRHTNCTTAHAPLGRRAPQRNAEPEQSLGT